MTFAAAGIDQLSHLLYMYNYALDRHEDLLHDRLRRLQPRFRLIKAKPIEDFSRHPHLHILDSA